MHVSAVTGGRYELVSRILQSRDVQYFRARAEGLGGFEKHVLLKRVSDSPGNDAARKRLGREAVACSKLSFHAIAGVYDFYHEDGHLYLAMELVDGVGLDEIMSLLRSSRTAIPFSAWLALAAQLLDAIDYIHKARDPVNGARLEIVHRDLSPDHIMVDRAGVLKLVGFGRCQVAGEEGEPLDRLTPWSPPELVARSQASPAADLYSAACVLYELFTLEPLALESVLTGRPVTLTPAQLESRLLLLQGEAESLRPLLRRALAPNPYERSRSAGELVATLRAGKRTSTASTPPNQVLRHLVERALELRAREVTDRGLRLESPPEGEVDAGAVVETIGWHPWRGDGSAPFRIDMESLEEDLDPEDASLFDDPPAAEPAPSSARPAKTVNLAEPEYTGEHQIPTQLELSRDRSLLATSPGLDVGADAGDSTETQRSEPTGFDWSFSVPRMVARGTTINARKPGLLRAGGIPRPPPPESTGQTDVRLTDKLPSPPPTAPATERNAAEARGPSRVPTPHPSSVQTPVSLQAPAKPRPIKPARPEPSSHPRLPSLPASTLVGVPRPLSEPVAERSPGPPPPDDDLEPATHVKVVPLWGGMARTPPLTEGLEGASTLRSALHELLPDRTLNGYVPLGAHPAAQLDASDHPQGGGSGPSLSSLESEIIRREPSLPPVREEPALLPPLSPLPESVTRVLEPEPAAPVAANFGTHSETTCELTIDDLEFADDASIRTSPSRRPDTRPGASHGSNLEGASLELIVLSQRAVVRVPLQGQGLNIGRSHRCDVVIVDEQVAPFHASLRREEGTWMLRACPGECLQVEGTPMQQLLLAPGTSCQLGPITLVVAPTASSPAPALCYESLHEELVREWPDLASQDALLQEAGVRLSEEQRRLPPDKLWRSLLEHFQNGADSRPFRRLLEVLSTHDPAEAWLQTALRTLRTLER